MVHIYTHLCLYNNTMMHNITNNIVQRKERGEILKDQLLDKETQTVEDFSGYIPIVMVNFMCQFGWATVSRYLVEHYCFYKNVFG